jgi:archaellum component FlaF (FlaF/FlaG flagellin family)
MLLTATVIMGTGVVNWSYSSISASKNSVANTSVNNSNQINEDLAIENIWFGASPSKFLNVTMTNIGSVSLNVTDIKITNSAQVLYDHAYSHGQILPHAQNSTLIFYNWQSDIPLQIVITTARGSTFQTQTIHP